MLTCILTGLVAFLAGALWVWMPEMSVNINPEPGELDGKLKEAYLKAKAGLIRAEGAGPHLAYNKPPKTWENLQPVESMDVRRRRRTELFGLYLSSINDNITRR